MRHAEQLAMAAVFAIAFCGIALMAYIILTDPPLPPSIGSTSLERLFH